MSSQSSHIKPRLETTKVTVGDINMSPSFQPVINRHADTGPKPAESRSPIRSLEKGENLKRRAELQLAQEELAKTRGELAVLEIVKRQDEHEMVHMKRLVNELTSKLKEAVEMSKKERLRANEMEQASFTAAEDWKADLEAMQRQYEAEVRDLQGVRLAYEDLKLEFAAALNAKEQAVRLVGEAMKEAEITAKQVESLSAELAEAKVSLEEASKAYKIIDELSKELSATKAVLAESNAACQSAAQERSAIMAGKDSELKKAIVVLLQAKNEVDQLKVELVAARQFEENVHEMNIELETLKNQLAVAKEAENHHAQVAMDTNAKLESVMSEIYQARLSETSIVSLLALVRSELRETQHELSRASVDVATLTASCLSQTKELEQNQRLLLELQEKESNAQAEAVASMSKFTQAEEDLKEALAREKKANETINTLTALLEDAKLETQTWRHQVSKASSEAQKESVESAAARDQELLIKKSLEAEQAENQKALTDLQVQQAMSVSAEKYETVEESRKGKAAQVWMCTEALSAAQEGADQTKSELQLSGVGVKVVGPGAEVANENALTERDQARHAREEAAVMRIGQLKTQAKTTQISSDAVGAPNCGKIKPQNGMEDNQAAQFSDSNTLYKIRKTHDISAHDILTGFSDSWEIVESSFDGGIALSKAECGNLKIKLQEAEEFKASIKTELDSLKCSNEKLSTNLDLAKLEIDTLKFSEQEARKLCERAENEKLILTAEVQRLARKGEQLLKAWEKESEALKSNTNNGLLPSMSAQRKLEREKLGQVLSMDLSTLPKEEEEEENAKVILFPTKKRKKRALLLRIGSYLAKKKNQ